MFLSRGFTCEHCHERLPCEADAVELVRDDSTGVVGPFCNDACADAWVAHVIRAATARCASLRLKLEGADVTRRPACEQRRR